MIDLTTLSVAKLLQLHADILGQLRLRKILRSSNNPSGDYAEYLFCKAFPWKLEENSKSGYDAKDEAGVRYQIKCRRLTDENPSRQLSFIRDMPKKPFDVLAAVLLEKNFQVSRAALIPFKIVDEKAVLVSHVNAWRFILRDTVWNLPGVEDVTPVLKPAQQIDL